MYFNRGLEDAHRDYSRAIELDPSFAAAYVADLRKALALDPTDNVTRANVDAGSSPYKKIAANSSDVAKRSMYAGHHGGFAQLAV
jgi:hypothetical protein